MKMNKNRIILLVFYKVRTILSIGADRNVNIGTVNIIHRYGQHCQKVRTGMSSIIYNHYYIRDNQILVKPEEYILTKNEIFSYMTIFFKIAMFLFFFYSKYFFITANSLLITYLLRGNEGRLFEGMKQPRQLCRYSMKVNRYLFFDK